MSKRRKARELALQILFQLDGSQEDLEEARDTFWLLHRHPRVIKDFTDRLVAGTRENLRVIDQKITLYARGWELERMAKVDKNVLRLAAYEILYCPDIPAKVTLNEAIELAKKFSTAKSGRFVNAVLDKIACEGRKK
jgi:N utilization substance protein B